MNVHTEAILDGHTGCRGSSPVLLTEVCPRTVITCFRCSTKVKNLTIVENNTFPDSSNHSLYLMKMFVFSRPKGNKLVDCSVGLFAPFSSHNERSERQYRHEHPQAFALLKPRSPSFKSILTFNVTKHIYKDIDTDIHKIHLHLLLR